MSHDTTIDPNQTVLVTGATGYVAGWLVKNLLDAGLTVHAAVRDPDNSDKVAHLLALADSAPGTLKLFKADLLDAGSYSEAMAGCTVVFHTASPFILTFDDAQKDLIEPARQGTLNVLDSVNKTDSVKRVVLTSSCAAIYGDNIDLQTSGKKALDETDWNTTSSLTHQPYSYSKTLAEKAAWETVEQQSRWDLVTINPSLVLGPGINPRSTSASLGMFKQFASGKLKAGVPAFYIAAVDVREVADAHVTAAFKPEARGRYILSGHDTSFIEFADILRNQFGNDYGFPQRILPKPLVWLVGPLADKSMTRAMVSRNVGHPIRFDHTKSEQELGIHYRPLKDSIADFFNQLQDSGQIPKAKH
ncbi:SDR family oxidoreductase [Saccharospirillum impatiens]|uniref:SDR family oxidoreductase n=1 Tax=Saccharospirillum impatiens TaxID=169438 RepID=UPI00041F5D8D|nr:aldehyde reductase [Saccharospirillum impatiens]